MLIKTLDKNSYHYQQKFCSTSVQIFGSTCSLHHCLRLNSVFFFKWVKFQIQQTLMTSVWEPLASHDSVSSTDKVCVSVSVVCLCVWVCCVSVAVCVCCVSVAVCICICCVAVCLWLCVYVCCMFVSVVCLCLLCVSVCLCQLCVSVCLCLLCVCLCVHASLVKDQLKFSVYDVFY